MRQAASGREESEGHEVKWQPYMRPFGVWSWAAPELPNGWTPSVTDDSQMYAPKRSTCYTANASCRSRLVTHPQIFFLLEDAKSAALSLALAQSEEDSKLSCLQHTEVHPPPRSRWLDWKPKGQIPGEKDAK